MTSNPETAQLLKKVAAVFRVMEGDTFRYKAYINAATAIENSSESVYELWQQGLLDNIPGIGVNLKKYLSEYFKTGKVRHFNSLLKKVPAGMFQLMEIRGIGPITAHKISKKFKLNNKETALKELKKILQEGSLSRVEGFKEKTIIKIKKALDLKSQAKISRLLLGEALEIAEKYLGYLRNSKEILKSETLGSLRRKVATVGDIDLAICSENPQSSMAYVLKYPEISGIITQGDNQCHVKLKNGYEVDIKHSYPDEWGSLLQHYTGSKMHNIKLRTLALEKDMSLSEYGITHQGHQNKFKDEVSFYKYLGMSYTPPEMREDKGEIELAINKKIPKLISEEDILGDLHIHSDFVYSSSHDVGETPLKEILAFAQNKNYQYIGITDHNPKFIELTEKEKINILIKRKKYLLDSFHAYENSVKKCTVKLLIGMEVDIKPNGELALSDEAMNLLDYAIVSIHSSFDQDTVTTTKRIINGLSHPKAIILGHPTGRMLNQREPINANWKEIFEFCSKNRKILEINASMYRLDLPDDLIRQAMVSGVKMVINTDSHYFTELSSMKYGVWQARRGWAAQKDIINTYSYKDLLSVINL